MIKFGVLGTNLEVLGSQSLNAFGCWHMFLTNLSTGPLVHSALSVSRL